MKKFILITLIILATSKNTAIEFGKEVSFDKNNNIFEFNSGESEKVFIHILFGTSRVVQFKLTTEGEEMNWSVKSPAAGLIYSISKNTIYTINFNI